MKWLVKAGCLVDKGWVTTEIEADSAWEAEDKAYQWARKSSVADSGNVYVEPLEEDKQLICNKLLEALQLTRNLHDLEDLLYLPEKELVEAMFSSGYRKYANVAADSGTAMIIDIIKQIV